MVREAPAPQTAAELMRILLRRRPKLLFSRKKSQDDPFLRKGWHKNPCHDDLKTQADGTGYEWWAVQPWSAGLFVVDVDKTLDGSPATREEVDELAGMLSNGSPVVYQSSAGRFHMLFEDDGAGGTWPFVAGMPDKGFASQGALVYKNLVFDTRGGGEAFGCHIKVDARRLRYWVDAAKKSAKGELGRVDSPEVLVAAYKRRRTAATATGAPPDGYHQHIASVTMRAARYAPNTLGKVVEDGIAAYDAADWPDSKPRTSAVLRSEWESASKTAVEKARQQQRDEALAAVVALANEQYAILAGGKMSYVDLSERHNTGSGRVWPVLLDASSADALLAKVSPGLTESKFKRHPDSRVLRGMRLASVDEHVPDDYLAIRLAAPPANGSGSTMAPARFDEYLLDVLCGGDEQARLWVLHFLTDMVQRPGEVGPKTALALTGAFGSGKSMLYHHVMYHVLGPMLCHALGTMKELADRFNHHLAGKTLIFGDEALFNADRALAAVLKSIITADTMAYEEKFRTKATLRHVSRYVVATNERVAAFIEPGDRRWTILPTPLSWSEDQIAAGENRKYFRPFLEGPDSMRERADDIRGYLRSIKVDREMIAAPLRTDAKREAVAHSTPLLGFMADVLANGVIPGDFKGRGEIAGEDLAEELSTRRRPVSKAEARTMVISLLGKAGEGGWRSATNLGESRCRRGYKFESPAALAELVNPMLPKADRIPEPADGWSKDNPCGVDL